MLVQALFVESRLIMAQKITTDLIRVAFRSFGQGEEKISNMQIYNSLDAQEESQKNTIRTRITDMVRAGEVIKIGVGLYQYNFKYKLRDASTAKGYTSIWRYVRQQKDGWTVKDCSMMTGQNNSHISRYVNWLENSGYVEVIGKGENNARLYKATKKAKISPETPNPPHTDKDPFEKERVAGAKIVRLLLCSDLYSKTVAKEIYEACEVLQARFCIKTNDSIMINENEA